MAKKDFGAAEFVISVQLKNTILNYKSTIHENRFYNFRKRNQKKLKKGTTNEYFVCLDCEKQISGGLKLKRYSKVTVSNGRIIKDPDFGHDKKCQGRTFAMIEAKNLERRARIKFRKGRRKPLEIYDEMFSELNSQFENTPEKKAVKALLPEYKKLEKSLQRWSKKAQNQTSFSTNMRGKNRLSIKNVDRNVMTSVEELNHHQNQRQNWLLARSAELGVLIFASELDIQLMHASTDLIIDGFSQELQDGFVHIYTIFAWGYFVYEAIPVCHAAVKYKSMESYVYLFKQIRETLIELHGGIGSLQTVHLDFEIAAHLALRQVFPQLTVKGCNFHFNKIINAKLLYLGLDEEIWEDTSGQVGEWISTFKTLSLIPPIIIPFVLKLLRRQKPVCDDEYVTRSLKEFSQYFEDNWVKGPFSLNVWNHWTNEGPLEVHFTDEYRSQVNSVRNQRFLTLGTFLKTMQPLHNRDQIRIQNLWTGNSLPIIRDGLQFRLDRRIEKARKVFCRNTDEIWPNLTLLDKHPNFLQDFQRDLRNFMSNVRQCVGKETRVVVCNH